MRLNKLDRPIFRVIRRGRSQWGVQAKWPSSGPWTRYQIWPRWVGHGPFGFHDYRWDELEGAVAFEKICNECVERELTRAG